MTSHVHCTQGTVLSGSVSALNSRSHPELTHVLLRVHHLHLRRI
jgi:hypothetical protein